MWCQLPSSDTAACQRRRPPVAEPISAARIALTDDGRKDPLLDGLPDEFEAFVGHKEACRVLPPTATLPNEAGVFRSLAT